MPKTKMPIKKKRAILKTFSLFCSILAFLFVFFELSLTTHGGWDDLNYGIIFVAPLVSSAALLFALVNIVKYRAKSHEILAALSMVALSALFFCYVMLYTSTVMLART